MPEYLAPGVYVEEGRNRGKAIEGVPTSTAGFVGAARFGPVSGLPVLVTSLAEYQRHFGDDADLVFGGAPATNHLAHAVRLFFENGGTRVHIARIFHASGRPLSNFIAASAALPTSAGSVGVRARFPGRAGNLRVRVEAVRSDNLVETQGGQPGLTAISAGDLVEIGATVRHRLVKPAGAPAGDPGEPLTANPGELAAVSFDGAGRPVLTASTGPVPLAGILAAQRVTLSLVVEPDGDGPAGTQAYEITGLSAHPDSKSFAGTVLRAAGSHQPVVLELPGLPATAEARAGFAGSLLRALVDNGPIAVMGGKDGDPPAAADYAGAGDTASGLAALAKVEDIAIVAAPGSAALVTREDRRAVRTALIEHCERLKYRFAVLAAENSPDIAIIRDARSNHDSGFAALYHPWLIVPETAPNSPHSTLAISPEGAICGLYARSDTQRGVHKAPANEVVRGVLRFSSPISTAIQDVLNPAGINCLRTFKGRGNLVWGARTISSDPEWRYVNVRRLLIHLEHSIDRGTRWAVFEPNDEPLWRKIRAAIEAFLGDAWRGGALTGIKPEEAFFVRCDRTTMTQSDLDAGRLVCQIGVAPSKPAEFIVFRIGQWTADATPA